MLWMEKIQPIAPLLWTAFAALFAVAILSLWLRSLSVYLAFTSILGGLFGIFTLYFGAIREVVWLAVSVLAVFGGMVYMLLFCTLALRRSTLQRRQRRAEIARRVQYTLPQRENTYIRTRLNTALHFSDTGEEEKIQTAVRLGYARILLTKVQAAPLTVADRVQVEEMGKIFTLYKGKEEWTVKEVNGVNNLCASLLKLSAKYVV